MHRLVFTFGTVPEWIAHHAKEGDVVAAEAQLDERYHNQVNIHLRRVSEFQVSQTIGARLACCMLVYEIHMQHLCLQLVLLTDSHSDSQSQTVF